MSKLTPREILTASAVVPVMAIDDLSTAVDLSHALVEGGIPTLEITLRTPVGLDAIRLIAKEVPNAIVGAGTVTNPEQLKAVEDAGRGFRHQPGFARIPRQSQPQQRHPPDSRRCHSGRSPTGFRTRHRYPQALPCRSRWRQSHAQSLYGPYADVRFCPTGGISLATAPEYLALPNVLCVGGSWLTPKEAIKNKDWDTITRLAREAATLKPKA